MRAHLKRLALACAAGVAALCLTVGAANPTPAAAQENTQGEVTSVAEKPKAALSVVQATPVVSDTSGYHSTITVRNSTDKELPAGRLSISTSVAYTFVSRSDFQDWSQSATHIPTPDELGSVDVPALAPKGKATVSVDANRDQKTLKAFASWGPKPVLIEYNAGDAAAPGSRKPSTATLHTFLTRSRDGLQESATPAMQVTVVLPLTADGWDLESDKLNTLMTKGQNSDSIVTPSNVSNDRRAASEAKASGTSTKLDPKQLTARHPGLQVVTDPAYAKASGTTQKTDGVMQPGNFDITAYAAHNDPGSYSGAGVTDGSWSAETSVSQYHEASGNLVSAPTAYAWQGRGNWTQEALTQAKRQGYSTVIAPFGLNSQSDSTVHTDKYEVPTDAGDVTVLAAQKELTQLAQGQPTDAGATAENSSAGRVSRFMAQSAFYQMEQPYASRNLLICLSPAEPSDEAEALMQSIEQASWLSLSNLESLNSAEPYRSGAAATRLLPQESGVSQKTDQALRNNLTALSRSRQDILRFGSSVLDTAHAAKATRDGDGTTGKDKQSSEQDGPQSLARRDAGSAAKRSQSGTEWVESITALHDRLALYALSGTGDTSLGNQTVQKAQSLSQQLLGGVSITPSEPVTVVSESAKMPVTVSNNHPYPVRVEVSSLTDSMEIVTSRFEEVSVPARGETQTTFAIRVSTSGSATAHLSLRDRDGTTFSAPQSTDITSTLRISDVTGKLFVVAALAMGALGLWRQFHRKKDPDE